MSSTKPQSDTDLSKIEVDINGTRKAFVFQPKIERARELTEKYSGTPYSITIRHGIHHAFTIENEFPIACSIMHSRISLSHLDGVVSSELDSISEHDDHGEDEEVIGSLENQTLSDSTGILESNEEYSEKLVNNFAPSRPSTIVVIDRAGNVFMWDVAKDQSSVLRATRPLGKGIYQLVYIKRLRIYACWSPDTFIRFFNGKFELMSVVSIKYTIQFVQYDDSCNQLIVAGSHDIAIFDIETFMSKSLIRVQLNHRLDFKTGFGNDEWISYISVDSSTGRIFAAIKSTVLIFDRANGSLISKIPNLARKVHCIMHYIPFHYTLLGLSDGSIKVLNVANYVVFEFNAHSKSVISIALYPISPLVISCGGDSTVKLLNLKTFKEVYSTRTKENAMGMSVVDSSQLFMYSRKTIEGYSISHISAGLASMNSRVLSMTRVKGQGCPSRILINSEDSIVRLVSPITGKCLTMSLPSMGSEAISKAVYSSKLDKLFLIVDKLNETWIADARSSPCVIEDFWKDTHEQYNCYAIFDGILDPVAETEAGFTLPSESHLGIKYENGFVFLLAGTENGQIVVLTTHGNSGVRIQVHNAGIISLVTETKRQLIYTCGMDKKVVISAFHPFRRSMVEPIMSVSLSSPAVHLKVLENTLAITHADNSLHMHQFNLITGRSIKIPSHSSSDDHTDEITVLDGISRLGIFATASKDNSIKVWSSQNLLLREVIFMEPVLQMCFANSNADLLVSFRHLINVIGSHLYLPPSYLQALSILRKGKIKSIESPRPFGKMDLNWKHFWSRKLRRIPKIIDRSSLHMFIELNFTSKAAITARPISEQHVVEKGALLQHEIDQLLDQRKRYQELIDSHLELHGPDSFTDSSENVFISSDRIGSSDSKKRSSNIHSARSGRRTGFSTQNSIELNQAIDALVKNNNNLPESPSAIKKEIDQGADSYQKRSPEEGKKGVDPSSLKSNVKSFEVVKTNSSKRSRAKVMIGGRVPNSAYLHINENILNDGQEHTLITNMQIAPDLLQQEKVARMRQMAREQRTQEADQHRIALEEETKEQEIRQRRIADLLREEEVHKSDWNPGLALIEGSTLNLAESIHVLSPPTTVPSVVGEKVDELCALDMDQNIEPIMTTESLRAQPSADDQHRETIDLSVVSERLLSVQEGHSIVAPSFSNSLAEQALRSGGSSVVSIDAKIGTTSQNIAVKAESDAKSSQLAQDENAKRYVSSSRYPRYKDLAMRTLSNPPPRPADIDLVLTSQGLKLPPPIPDIVNNVLEYQWFPKEAIMAHFDVQKCGNDPKFESGGVTFAFLLDRPVSAVIQIACNALSSANAQSDKNEIISFLRWISSTYDLEAVSQIKILGCYKTIVQSSLDAGKIDKNVAVDLLESKFSIPNLESEMDIIAISLLFSLVFEEDIYELSLNNLSFTGINSQEKLSLIQSAMRILWKWDLVEEIPPIDNEHQYAHYRFSFPSCEEIFEKIRNFLGHIDEQSIVAATPSRSVKISRKNPSKSKSSSELSGKSAVQKLSAFENTLIYAKRLVDEHRAKELQLIEERRRKAEKEAAFEREKKKREMLIRARLAEAIVQEQKQKELLLLESQRQAKMEQLRKDRDDMLKGRLSRTVGEFDSNDFPIVPWANTTERHFRLLAKSMAIDRLSLDPFGHDTDDGETKGLTTLPVGEETSKSEIHSVFVSNRDSNHVHDALASFSDAKDIAKLRSEHGSTLTIRTNKKYFIPILSAPSDDDLPIPPLS